MFEPYKIVGIELTDPLPELVELGDYRGVRAYLRWHGRPVGWVHLPTSGSSCSAHTLKQEIVRDPPAALLELLLNNALAAAEPANVQLADLWDLEPPLYEGGYPLVTVAICTRNRPEQLARCLEAADRLAYPNLDLLVIDNAPDDDRTAGLVRSHFPQVRYRREERAGLNRARNRAIQEAKGSIIAFTDDDVIVDRNWIEPAVRIFEAAPDVMAVTGLVLPYELETEAQYLFEHYGGFGRGFRQTWYRGDQLTPGATTKAHGGTGKFGTGANMFYRRSVFEQIGGFEPALDVGTPSNGGGDLEMFFRILKRGQTLVYEPAATVFHQHRRRYADLRRQIADNGVGFYAYLTHNMAVYPEERWATLRLGLWWFWRWYLRRLGGAWLRPTRLPIDLIWAELRGALRGMGRYRQARRQRYEDEQAATIRSQAPRRSAHAASWPTTAVRMVEIDRGLPLALDVGDAARTRVYARLKGHNLGHVDIENRQRPISGLELRTRLADSLSAELLRTVAGEQAGWREQLQRALNEKLRVAGSAVEADAPAPLVSIVVATYDRPDTLRACLQSLAVQTFAGPVEVVVVDNHPGSGQTPPVLAEFPDAILVNEPRQGLARARNSGVRAARGEIIVMTDDDVTVPPEWLSALITPFERRDVMAVTGNVLPRQLDTPAQQIFEAYGGLGRGNGRVVFNTDWFESFRFRAVPTWNIGATANAAFRAAVFRHPQIGLLDETLGAGTPTGVGEDTELFYRVLKAGYAIVYEPDAYVWHTHRATMKAVRRQLFDYSKGHVAYHLVTLQRAGDWRGVLYMLLRLPYSHLWRLGRRFTGQSRYPISLQLVEISGYFLGPLALWRSWRQARRLAAQSPGEVSLVHLPYPQEQDDVRWQHSERSTVDADVA